MKLQRGSRSPPIAKTGDQKGTFNRGSQVSDNGMRLDLRRFDNSKGFCILSTDRYAGRDYDDQDMEAGFDDIMKKERRRFCLRYQMVTKEEGCLPPATEPLRCYSPSSTTPLAELETIQSLEIVEPSFLSRLVADYVVVLLEEKL
ncbi:hypothetical protein Bca52824_033756 [Brassica carinata]|uniref:Uncharacterized protein n=1 Tax=Brassica carinata TaxID=52824 RepID=A0A8X7SEK0_BRACI|nr:hypothetical protein Bca52824_033756 [Brassica carinata]